MGNGNTTEGRQGVIAGRYAVDVAPATAADRGGDAV